jgi:hypothetical protein
MLDIILPRGYWLDGECHREARVRPINGSDEAFLLDVGEALLPVQQTTAILSRCLTKLGPFCNVSPEMVRSLCIGDRDALMLHLRRITFGERMDCVLACPETNCEEQMDFSLIAGDLISHPYLQSQFWHRSRIVEDNRCYEVIFRLPNGGDQEASALEAIKSSSYNNAIDLLLNRCVRSVITDDGEESDSKLPFILPKISDIIAKLDPQAEIVLEMVCPACNHSFSASFDPSEYLIREIIENPIDHLYRDVHLLAYHYKWSEGEIMSMTPRKRRRYIELLTDTLEAGR